MCVSVSSIQYYSCSVRSTDISAGSGHRSVKLPSELDVALLADITEHTPSPFGEEDRGELSPEAADELSAECDGDCVKGEGVCSVMSASRATSSSLGNLTDLCPDPALISVERTEQE